MAAPQNTLVAPQNTLVIDNFQGRLTRYAEGDINSGFAKYATTFGNDPFTKPGNLTWFESPTSFFDTSEIGAARVRVENGTTYVYAVSSAPSSPDLYKIQVNDTGTRNPNYDNPTTIDTLNTQTFRYGPSIQYYGATTEKLFIGGDDGVTKINFDGTSETLIGTVGTGQWVADVPRPSVEFQGKTYWGNGNNIAEIDSTELVTNYNRLSPSFPIGTQVRDMRVSADGNYIQIVVSYTPGTILMDSASDTGLVASTDSFLFLWNGTDEGATAVTQYPARSLSGGFAFGENNYSVGYDINGAALFENGIKLFNLPYFSSPNFSAFFSLGNMIAVAAPESDSDGSDASLFLYGSFDSETPPGLYRLFRLNINGIDIAKVPVVLPVSNQYYGLTLSGYTDNLVGSAKIYFSISTVADSDIPIQDSKLYKFSTSPTGLGSAIAGVYETQSQLFSKKVQIKEVRVYFEPMVANNSFQVDLIGSDGNPMTNGTKIFTAGSGPNAVGDDYAWWNPTGNGGVAPTYVLGIRISNLGSANMTFAKVEVDYQIGGK